MPENVPVMFLPVRTCRAAACSAGSQAGLGCGTHSVHLRADERPLQCMSLPAPAWAAMAT